MRYMPIARHLTRSLYTMESPGVQSSKFAQRVVAAMRELYPESIADKSFDNTGLLLEAPATPDQNNDKKSTALATIDLTKAVAEEAIRRKASIIIAYHPIIFFPLKSLTLKNSQQQSLLRLVQAGISVYSPHTAVDAAPGGLGDWLAEIVCPSSAGNVSTTSYPVHPIIHKIQGDIPEGFEEAGYGRIMRFDTPQRLGDIVSRVKKGLGNLSAVFVAVPQNVPESQRADVMIRSAGVCAGSGGSTLGKADIDLLVTGELDHHAALAAIEQGKCIITVFHSNSERAYLKERMVPDLEMMLHKHHGDTEFEILVSEVDKDPFQVVSGEM